MSQFIHHIPLSLPYGRGNVNCYLIQTDADYVLIDTGCSNDRTALERALAGASCRPGTLRLILLTHGDFDHAGNAAYLRARFRTPIAMHPDDSGMVERGDMFWSRNKRNRLIGWIAPSLTGFGSAARFKPDILVRDGFDLSTYGCQATVLSLLGHSRGSIGIRTAGGDLFCGDLLENRTRPAIGSIMDDLTAAAASVDKLKRLRIGTVYPGHGQPFPFEQLVLNIATR